MKIGGESGFGRMRVWEVRECGESEGSDVEKMRGENEGRMRKNEGSEDEKADGN